MYFTSIHGTCKFEKHKHSSLSENYEQTFRNKNHKNHIEVEGGKSSFLLSLGDCPVGGSSVEGRVSTFLNE